MSYNEVLTKLISACPNVILNKAQGEACRHRHTSVFLLMLVLLTCTDSANDVVHTSLSHTQQNPLLLHAAAV